DVPVDHLPGDLEVAGQQLAHLFGVPALGERGEADEIGEEHRDDAALDTRGRRMSTSRNGGPVERAAALTAEALVRLVRRAAGRALDKERRSTPRAELAPRTIDTTTGGALGPFCCDLGHAERIGPTRQASNRHRST